jgi:hypothetical protein
MPGEANLMTMLRVDQKVFGSSKVRDSKWVNDPKPYAPLPFKALLSSVEAHYLYSKNLGPGNYAHLGVYRGGSPWCQVWGLKDTDAKIYCIDLWEIVPGADAEDAEKDFFKLTCDAAGFGDKIVICKGSTCTWARKLSKLTFRFVFIDAAHDTENCQLDWDCWSPLVEKGGEVTFHDSDLLSVQRVMNKIDLTAWEKVDTCYTLTTFRKK